MIVEQIHNMTEVFFNSIYEIENTEIPNQSNAVNQRESERNTSGHSVRGARISAEEWWGVSGNYPAVKNLVSTGWHDGVEKANKALNALAVPRIKTVRRRKVRSDFGDHIDMQAVYGGSLDKAWESTRREAGVMQQGNTVTIAVNLSAAWNVTADRMFWKGAVVTILCDELQKSGRNIRIVGYSPQSGVYRNGGSKCVLITLKNYQDPLNINVLATTTALSGFFRSYIFKAIRLDENRVRSSLGIPMNDYKPNMLKEESNVVYIEDVWSQCSAQQLINKIGGQING